MDDLKHQIMVNQFMLAAGCHSNEAKEHLKTSHWQYETALSRYFQESGIPHQHNHHPMHPPTNTPATPPAFPEALLAFSKMQASDKMSSQPLATSPQAQQPSGSSTTQEHTIENNDNSKQGIVAERRNVKTRKDISSASRTNKQSIDLMARHKMKYEELLYDAP